MKRLALLLILLLAACAPAAPTAAPPPTEPPQAAAPAPTTAAPPPTAPPAEATAAPAPPAGEEEGGVQVRFEASSSRIQPGECVTLRWRVSGQFFEVGLGDERVDAEGQKQVCPAESTFYRLWVDLGDRLEERTVGIQVGEQPLPEEGAPPPGGPPPGEEPALIPEEGGALILPPPSALGATVPPWDAAQAQAVSVSVDAAQTGSPISPYVYGTFIEHQGRCIYGGIWAEMLRDRKFYHPVNYYFPWGLEKFLSPWFANAPDTVVTMDEEHAYVGQHSPRVFVDGVRPRGIVQRRLGLRAGQSYSGYVILAATGKVQAEVSLVWGPGADDRQTLDLGQIGEEYAKIPISLTAGGDTENGALEIAGRGQGNLFIGPPSLMPADNVQGIRADTLALLKELGFTVYRWPGGTFVNHYDWRQAIGDRDKRPPILNNAYWSEEVESNDFGLDEFLTLCQLTGAEAYIAVSVMDENDVPLAAQEVEYVNGGADTPMGQRRAANGHPEPYGVRFWGVGNEAWFFINLAEYIPLQNKVAQAMWAVDPSLRLIAVGAAQEPGTEADETWSQEMLRKAGDYMTLISEHVYAGSALEVADHSRSVALETENFVRPHRQYRAEMPELQGKDIRLALDEWNYVWANRPEIYGEAAPRYYFRDALGIARGLHAIFDNSDLIEMVNFHAVNTHGQVKTTQTAAAIEATGLAWELYRRHFGTLPLTVNGATDPLDVAAAWTEDQTALTVAVVNPTEQSYRLDLSLQNAAWGGGGQWWYVSAPPWAYNEPGQPPQVRIRQDTVEDPTAGLPVPPLSVNVYVLPAQ